MLKLNLFVQGQVKHIPSPYFSPGLLGMPRGITVQIPNWKMALSDDQEAEGTFSEKSEKPELQSSAVLRK